MTYIKYPVCELLLKDFMEGGTVAVTYRTRLKITNASLLMFLLAFYLAQRLALQAKINVFLIVALNKYYNSAKLQTRLPVFSNASIALFIK